MSAICVDGDWTCPSFDALPSGEEWRCSPPDESLDGTGSDTSDSEDTDPSGSGSTTGAPPTDGALDLLFVIDNTATMGAPQRDLAAAAEVVVDELLAAQVDLHGMVTSTDMNNPLCAPFQPEDDPPLLGAPNAERCLDRPERFTSLGGQVEVFDICLETCEGISGTDASVLAGTLEADNADGAMADAVACRVAMGIRGCGYESPLESMLQALNPGACWNTEGGCSGNEVPFLRADAALAIVILTDELDCSLADPAAMNDPDLYSTNPVTGQPEPTSALCANAGLACDGETCQVRDDGPLHPVSRYRNALEQMAREGKSIRAVTLAGTGATEDRDWTDTDVLPAEAAQGTSAPDLQHVYGVAPSCVDGPRGRRALPSPRLTAALCDGGTVCAQDFACADQPTFESTLRIGLGLR